MNSTKTKTSRISSDSKKPLDLELVYEFCRALPEESLREELKPQFYNINNAPVDGRLKANLRRFKKQLMELVKSIPTKFHPAFIELSLYDPRDRSGNIFYSVLFADDESAIGCYRKQMEDNLEMKNALTAKRSKANRGPIIPNKLLHESVYYSLPFHLLTVDDKEKKFDSMGDELKAIFAGSYNTSGKYFTNRKEDLEDHIENFLLDVSNNCMKSLEKKDGAYKFNFAALLPLFRPAAKFKGETETIYNGGGIFLYGSLEKPDQENEFILALQTILTKSIFKASHTQIAYDEVDSYNSYFTAMIIHQLKNKLTNNVTYELSSLLKKKNLQNEVRESLIFSKEYVENLVNKLSIFLNNFQPGYKDSVGSPLRYRDFENIIDNISQEKKIDYELTRNDLSNFFELMIRKEDFELIIEELFENAMKYYRAFEIPTNKRKMIVKWNGNSHEKILQLLFLSENTIMPTKHLDNFGNKIITGTDSSGLGGFLINYALEQNNARRFPNGKFVNPKNTENGFSVEINFITT